MWHHWLIFAFFWSLLVFFFFTEPCSSGVLTSKQKWVKLPNELLFSKREKFSVHATFWVKSFSTSKSIFERMTHAKISFSVHLELFFHLVCFLQIFFINAASFSCLLYSVYMVIICALIAALFGLKAYERVWKVLTCVIAYNSVALFLVLWALL